MEFEDKYNIHTQKNRLPMLLWLINPIVAVQELVLGERVPKTIFEDKTNHSLTYVMPLALTVIEYTTQTPKKNDR